MLGLMACAKSVIRGGGELPCVLGAGREAYPGQWAGVNDSNFSTPGRRTGTLRVQPDQDPFEDEYGPWVP